MGGPASLGRPAPELVALCSNAASYETARHDVAPFAAWPMPHGGYKLRIYQYDKLPAGHRNVFRSRNVMISYAGHPGDGPRDPKRFSPHSHTDFEQISLELWGSYAHHLRYPWEPDSTAWRDDAHFTVQAPGITVMPVNVIHTSQAMALREAASATSSRRHGLTSPWPATATTTTSTRCRTARRRHPRTQA